MGRTNAASDFFDMSLVGVSGTEVVEANRQKLANDEVSGPHANGHEFEGVNSGSLGYDVIKAPAFSGLALGLEPRQQSIAPI